MEKFISDETPIVPPEMANLVLWFGKSTQDFRWVLHGSGQEQREWGDCTRPPTHSPGLTFKPTNQASSACLGLVHGVIRNEHFFFVLFAELSRTPELSDSFSQPLGLFQSIGQLLERYQGEGVLKAESSLHSVASLLGPLIYFSMISRSAGNISTPPMDIETHIAYFLNGRQIVD